MGVRWGSIYICVLLLVNKLKTTTTKKNKKYSFVWVVGYLTDLVLLKNKPIKSYATTQKQPNWR